MINKDKLKNLSKEQIKKLIELRNRKKTGVVVKIKEDKKFMTKKDKLEEAIETDRLKRLERKAMNKIQNIDSKISSNMRSLIKDLIREFIQEISLHLNDRIDKEILSAKKLGHLYKADFMVLKFKDVSISKMKELGEQGWKFNFELNENYYFQRERNVWDNVKKGKK